MESSISEPAATHHTGAASSAFLDCAAITQSEAARASHAVWRGNLLHGTGNP